VRHILTSHDISLELSLKILVTTAVSAKWNVENHTGWRICRGPGKIVVGEVVWKRTVATTTACNA